MLFGGVECNHCELPASAYLGADVELRKKKCLAQLRVGACPIRANRDHDLLYSERICTRCDGGCVDNEHHLLFECGALTRVRHKHAATLAGTNSVVELMAAAYDKGRAGGLMSYVSDIFSCLDGHWQGTHREGVSAIAG